MSRRGSRTLVLMTTNGTSQLEFGGITLPSDAPTAFGSLEQPETKTLREAGSKRIHSRGHNTMKEARGNDGARVTPDRSQPLEALLNFAEAAKLLGISLRQFRRLVDGGKITFVKVSQRSPRVRPGELQRYLAASAIKYSEDPS